MANCREFYWYAVYMYMSVPFSNTPPVTNSGVVSKLVRGGNDENFSTNISLLDL